MKEGEDIKVSVKKVAIILDDNSNELSVCCGKSLSSTNSVGPKLKLSIVKCQGGNFVLCTFTLQSEGIYRAEDVR